MDLDFSVRDNERLEVSGSADTLLGLADNGTPKAGNKKSKRSRSCASVRSRSALAQARLRELFIQDIVLIERLTIPLADGLTALTGETGAGKSIMLDALGLAMGARADKSLVRQGVASGIVSAAFDVPTGHAVWQALASNGFAEDIRDQGEIILRRVQEADGPSRAYINDQPVSISLLREIGAALIEVHGQHAGQGFLEVAAHRSLLDAFGGLEGQVSAVKAAWQRVQAARDTLDEKEAARDAALREADYLRHVVEELGALAPMADEEAALASRRAALMAAEKVAGEMEEAASLLNDDATERRLTSVLARLEKISPAGREAAGEASGAMTDTALMEVVTRIDAALTELAEARQTVSAALEKFQYDADELNTVEERLFALRAAARKYNVLPGDLHLHLQQSVEALNLLDRDEETFEILKKNLADAREAYGKRAEMLSAARRKAAAKLDKAVKKELEPLKLGKAVFKVEVQTGQDLAGATGIDRVQFLISTNPGAPLGPLKQIASGGELSRFVLALKAALMAQENRTVIIFDEVDAGIGGAVADAVGERLAKLAANAQVLVVTHAPQVAARARAHFQVAKSGSKKITTRIAVLSPEQRIDEIARMLSGAKITQEARAAAVRLLEQPATGAKKTTA
ncbi:DNA repair protein RecN [Parvularcula sp. IMCC14364]|uniref:DNA repair protein RecN n=1 Tax=Parvularcula sp. IMCC14364 TaxID=3067902 RepID=UPI002740AB65|nr:DNA repair protein RecN [Parvularcula sp. IMCC14364]